MHSTLKRSLAYLILAVLSGCADMGSIRLVQDKPADVELLLDQNEYARIRQLTGRYPEIDTPELQGLVAIREQAYSDTVTADARAMEAKGDLLGAVSLLSEALQRVPHSDSMRELRNTLEKERVQELKRNERELLISRARYMLDQQTLYQQQANLAPPGIGERWEKLRLEKEATQLSAQLLDHGEYALLQGNLVSAETCLQLSLLLNHTDAAEEMLSRMQSLKSSREEVLQKKESIKQAIKEQNMQRSQKQQTQAGLIATQQALRQNDLQGAIDKFKRIPEANSGNRDVIAVKDNLHEAVSRHVAELIATGDSLYRADNVTGALRQWNEARLLDPENQQLQERIDRANRVLARLEELKRQQP